MKSLFETTDDAPRTAPRRAADGGRIENPVRIIWRQRWLFLPVFAAVLLVAVAALLLLPARYFTAGSLIVAEPESGLSLPPAGWAQKVGDPADIESQLLVIRSTRVMRLVLDRPDVVEMIRMECDNARNPLTALFSPSSCRDLTADSPAAIDYLLSHYSVSGVGRSRVINIGYTSRQPAVAQSMANTLINAFLMYHRDGISDGRAVAVNSLSEEITRLDGEIRADDGRIQVFRSAKGLTSGATAPITSERLSSVSAQLALAESARSQAASIIAAAKEGGAGAAATLPAVLESRTVADAKQRLSAATEQAGAAAISLGPRHPRLRALEGQISALKVSLDREVANVVDSARKQFDAADRTVKSLRTQLETAKTEASSATGDETSIEQMVRDLAVKRDQYASLFDQRRKLESEQKALLGSTRLVSLAELPDTRFFPKTTPFVAGGFVLGLIMASAAALLRGHLVRDGDEGVPPAGGEGGPVNGPHRRSDEPSIVTHVPRIGDAYGRDTMLSKLVTADDNPDARAALQDLLAGLIAQGGNGRIGSVAMLSAFAQEGKTFTTLALARFAAHAGHRVLLVEADMRNPTLETLFGLKARRTFVDILAGHASPASAVIRTDVAGLDMIVAGDPGDVCPTELLMSAEFIDFLTWTKVYDLVLIDGPALDRQMDAGLLSCRADGFLFCLRGDEEQIVAVSDITRRLTNLGARPLGFVMTPPLVAKRFAGLRSQIRAVSGRS